MEPDTHETPHRKGFRREETLPSNSDTIVLNTTSRLGGRNGCTSIIISSGRYRTYLTPLSSLWFEDSWVREYSEAPCFDKGPWSLILMTWRRIEWARKLGTDCWRPQISTLGALEVWYSLPLKPDRPVLECPQLAWLDPTCNTVRYWLDTLRCSWCFGWGVASDVRLDIVSRSWSVVDRAQYVDDGRAKTLPCTGH